MVNNVVFDYIKNNRANFSLDELKKQIVSTGYSIEDFNEAVAESDKTIEASGVATQDVYRSELKGFKWIKTASIIGFVFFFFGVLFNILSLLDINMSVNINPMVSFGIMGGFFCFL